jgi:hypothetical protein
MEKLEKAISLLEATIGKVDNVKLLLSGNRVMTRENVADDFLDVATAFSEGKIKPKANLGEGRFAETVVDL